MSMSVATTVPLIGQLGALVQWLLLANILLVGACVILGHRAITLARRVRELEEREGGAAAPDDAATAEPGDTP